ncbi:Hpt domain-containing protein [Sulfurimonas sediminis]|uniref:Hpt domain-containing protein n=1 Tax=Sulfurimonas sediminis TaxID=2590020 RepID=A0A7M1B434_9BACT|nr:Hpt domain-containing protein [Sulfurimonas sediminis]QOP44464.1 Hpt domain-containing protein [Sulfurimonas sediminis]
MLIYNFQKEFLGIDEKNLRTLGYKDLADLRAEVTDFADLFVKTPGYIHNFQHVHWIDYITCAESNEESKVIIHANSKNYKAIITITNAYLVDNPTQKAYIVHLNNLRTLTAQEYDAISGDITQRTIPETVSPQQSQPILQTEETTVIQDEYDTPLHVETKEKEDLDALLDVGDLSIETQEVKKREPLVQESPQKPKSTYVFDPNIASKELGLPLDLIEEFIQDFITQANDFKDELYRSLEEGDTDNVKTLSHKLKGVAANLRIEDAHEVLSIINATSDVDIIKTNLDDFYRIIAKLAGEEDLGTIKDDEVPQKIEIPELYDDDFVAPQESEEILTFKDDEPELTLEFKEEPQPQLETEPEIQEEQEIQEETEQQEESQTQEESENEKKYSKEKIANEIGLDLESFNELFEDFIKEAHAIIAKINDALATQDYPALKRQALKLKGMSDNMRMHTFTNELETLTHSTDKETLTQTVKEIENILTAISKEEE